MNGSVPANVSALVKQAEAGAELAYRAYTKELAEDGSIVRRGVISHYAAATIAGAHDLAGWLTAIEQMSQADLATGVITPFYQPARQVIGDARLPLHESVQANPA